jgi:hypothetical protein
MQGAESAGAAGGCGRPWKTLRRALPGSFSAFPTADHNLLENGGRFPQPLGKLGPPVGRLARLSHSSLTDGDDDDLSSLYEGRTNPRLARPTRPQGGHFYQLRTPLVASLRLWPHSSESVVTFVGIRRNPSWTKSSITGKTRCSSFGWALRRMVPLKGSNRSDEPTSRPRAVRMWFERPARSLTTGRSVREVRFSPKPGRCSTDASQDGRDVSARHRVRGRWRAISIRQPLELRLQNRCWYYVKRERYFRG